MTYQPEKMGIPMGAGREPRVFAEVSEEAKAIINRYRFAQEAVFVKDSTSSVFTAIDAEEELLAFVAKLEAENEQLQDYRRMWNQREEEVMRIRTAALRIRESVSSNAWNELTEIYNLATPSRDTPPSGSQQR